MPQEEAFKAEPAEDESSLPDLWWRVAQEFKQNGRFRFSVVDGRRYYEPAFTCYEPSLTQIHQIAIDGIRESIQCSDASFTVRSHVPVAFDEWTLLCPDVAIWSPMPYGAIEPVQQPLEAIVEVLTAFALDRDLGLGLDCYLKAGIKDIFIVDPGMGQTYHFKPGEPERNYTSPHTLTLDCGCQITV